MRKNRILKIICVLSGLLFVISCTAVAYILVTESEDKRAFDELAEIVEQAETDNNGDESASSVLSEYAALHRQNSDMFGWLSIDGTKINYPVMHTPKEPQYYLRKAFDKSYSVGGTPFLDGDCTEEGGMYIIYGHRMNNGTMFGTLTDYADKDFWQQHRTIRFDTLHEHGEYEVIAAFLSKVYDDGEQGFRYYEYTDLSSEMIFNGFVKQLRENALYDTGTDVKYGDRILVLSTCNHYIENGRFVVVARKK